MSLTLGVCCKEGIILASDPFVFDNHAETPQKLLSFDKFHVSSKHQFAMVSVGSQWVFHEFIKWIESSDVQKDQPLDAFGAKWNELNIHWRTKREEEIEADEIGTLRPLSDSLLIIARIGESDTINILDSDGELSQTGYYVFSGSGSYLVRYFLQESKKPFDSSMSLRDCLSFISECYSIASSDLYVVGFPAIILVTSDQITDLSKECATLWDEGGKRYFERVQTLLLKVGGCPNSNDTDLLSTAES